jgi:hypothetical protein
MPLFSLVLPSCMKVISSVEKMHVHLRSHKYRDISQMIL